MRSCQIERITVLFWLHSNYFVHVPYACMQKKSIQLGNQQERSRARHVSESFEPLKPILEKIRLVQDFLRTEISIDFELIHMLSRGVGVHHAGLSDEVRTLIEWLAEESRLRVLCATTTIAQGINFPVASVFLSS